ncbi:MAG: hypothetical protein K1X94_08235 [Sandaracinaceae bacterium]|nr:hypothetical protein [Sandaracinaceae bacterium]
MSLEPAITSLLGPIQLALRQERARGWLLYDHRGRSAVSERLLAMREGGTERRFFYWIPAEGLPVAIVHVDDAWGLPELPGDRTRYRTAIELRAALEAHVPREGTVLLEQAPFAQIADLAIVDEATLSLLRGRDTVVRSSLELANRFAGPLSAREREDVIAVSAAMGALRAGLTRRASAHPFTAWRELFAAVAEEAEAASLELAPDSGFAIDAFARGQRAPERDGGPIVPGSYARLDVWARARGSEVRVLVPSGLELSVGPEAPAHASLASVLAASEDELVRAIDERAKTGRVLGSEVAELAYEVLRRRGLAYTSSCVGWPLGAVPRGSHACTFDAEGFADPRELVPGTLWALRLGVDDKRAIAWRTSLIERTEHGVRMVSRHLEGVVLVSGPVTA